MSGTDYKFKLRDGRNLGYAIYGDPKGNPLFFFHGWPGSRLSGVETDIAGKKLGVKIVSTDRPGIGLSDFQKNRKLLDWPYDVTQLADYLKIKKFSVLGVSGGGPYAAVCAYKLGSKINKTGIVVGLGPLHIKENLTGIAWRGKIGWANFHRLPILRTISALGSAIQFKYIPFIGSLFAFPSKEDRKIFRDTMKNSNDDNNGPKEAFRQGIKGPSHELKIYSEDWGFNLKNIKSKVYLWYGAKDKCVSVNMGKYYHSQIPDSELIIDPTGVHLSRYFYEEKILATLIE